MGLILAIDQGTTGTTCLVVDMAPTQGGVSVVGRGYQEFPQYFPKPGWVEHDLTEIWQSTRHAIAAALQNASVQASSISAIGMTNQRETTGLWRKSDGQPVHRAIVWQDRRTTGRCQRLREEGHGALIRSRTGLVIDPYFSGTKLGWLLDEVPHLRGQAEGGTLLFGTIDTWLVYQLTGGGAHVTDVTNASRTTLFDIHRGTWDADLLDVMGNIPASLLPKVHSCCEEYGTTRGVSILPDGIPITGMAGDQQAALFGQACFTPGMAKCTYGTGAFALVNTGTEAIQSKHGLLTTIAWRLGDRTTYAIEGSAFIAGAIVQWLRDGLQFFQSSADIEKLARSVDDSDGVIVVPALTGLGAPHWRPEARGLITGITRGTTRAHLARAALEGIALQMYDLLGVMEEDMGQKINILRVDGGASANSMLMQFQADILNIPIHRPTVCDTTALGAAYLAAMGVGLFSNTEEITNCWSLDRIYEPAPNKARINAHIDAWRIAVDKA